MDRITLTSYDREFLELSWIWLQDPEIKKLTLTSDFTREQQMAFFNSLHDRKDYLIYGVQLGTKKIGVAGLKNIKNDVAEYWGYIGEKDLWGKGIGKFVIEEIERIANNFGIKKLYLKVSEFNPRAIKAYHKSGFVISNSQNNVIFMEKVI
ncbi:GNAT family N-acetyltransferase [Cronobacter muytjensii]|uniref:GNAT family N-acetyltransferase n=1 Tax=Cronobacter muytjensii TaxID=413501 RepID=UPI0029E4E68E|nr:GNAT family N-acetyltransferase [Cronobacter muytjensii]EKS1846393.1 GNAT family N-acetyltransferase [Cronobacter muytjensii]ELY3985923.1 GNAT family N-acetyltransferase [Cronobacter muytjensii]ELY4520690.1 GNAT family N-acetyltransferase [Cronobacter muytjensii]ELY4664933.1 GNAT family N-acetyltransferase [Cronobacter muytjensii]ELY6276355.1 GNAT family N-acetyltransferase [Cronobacter muytjensii]